MRLPDGGNGNAAALRRLDLLAEPEYANLLTGLYHFYLLEAGVCQSVAEPKTVRDLWVHKQDEWMGPTSSAERLPTAEYTINDTFRTMRIGRHPLI